MKEVQSEALEEEEEETFEEEDGMKKVAEEFNTGHGDDDFDLPGDGAMDRKWSMADILADPKDVETWKKYGSLRKPKKQRWTVK